MKSISISGLNMLITAFAVISLYALLPTIAFATTYTCPSGLGATASTVVDSSCYAYFSTTKNRADAETACTNIGGHLTAIRSSTVNSAVVSIISNSVWIGGSDDNAINTGASEGNFFWIGDNQAFWTGGLSGASNGGAYTNWDTGEPNNDHGGGESCVEFYTSSGRWNDLYCSMSRSYVCQIPATATETASSSSYVQHGGGLRGVSLQMRIDQAVQSRNSAHPSAPKVRSKKSQSSVDNQRASEMALFECTRLQYMKQSVQGKQRVNTSVYKKFGVGCNGI